MGYGLLAVGKEWKAVILSEAKEPKGRDRRKVGRVEWLRLLRFAQDDKLDYLTAAANSP